MYGTTFYSPHTAQTTLMTLQLNERKRKQIKCGKENDQNHSEKKLK
jgi:hypothetical protein